MIYLCIAGVFPQIKENNYYNHGSYRVDAEVSPTMKNSLMYKLCYYNFDRVRTKQGAPTGYDTVRNCEIGVSFLLFNEFSTKDLS